MTGLAKDGSGGNGVEEVLTSEPLNPLPHLALFQLRKRSDLVEGGEGVGSPLLIGQAGTGGTRPRGAPTYIPVSLRSRGPLPALCGTCVRVFKCLEPQRLFE